MEESFNKYGSQALDPLFAALILAALAWPHQWADVFVTGGIAPLLAALIIFFTRRQGWIAKALGGPLLSKLGEASYVLYILQAPLWHYWQETTNSLRGVPGKANTVALWQFAAFVPLLVLRRSPCSVTSKLLCEHGSGIGKMETKKRSSRACRRRMRLKWRKARTSLARLSETLLLPSTAQGAVELNVVQHLVQLCLDQRQLGGIGSGYCVEDFQITGGAAAIAEIGKPAGVLGGVASAIPAACGNPGLLVGNQRVGDFAKRLLNGLLIIQFRFLLLRLGQPHATSSGCRRRKGVAQAGP